MARPRYADLLHGSYFAAPSCVEKVFRVLHERYREKKGLSFYYTNLLLIPFFDADFGVYYHVVDCFSGVIFLFSL